MKKSLITVVSLGIGGADRLTAETLNILKSARNNFFRTELLPCVPELKEAGIVWTSLDSFYDRYEDFDEMHEAMADMLLNEAENGPLVYAVIDSGNDGSVRALNRKAGEKNPIRVIPGVSLFDLYSASCASIRDSGTVTILPAAEALSTVFSQNQAYLITEIDTEIRAGEIKLWMENAYDEEAPVYFLSCNGNETVCTRIRALEADRQARYDHTTAFFIPMIPFEKRVHYSFDDLNALMDRLRGFDGCPWDREQTHQSLKTYLLEEAWEVAGAIDSEDPDHLADELGDLMFQIVFHASIGKDFDEFTVQDVLDHVCRKMIYRHSHIFGNDHCANAAEVSQNWEKKKRAENGDKTVTDSLRSVSEALPALTYASKVLKKASHYPWWSERSGEILNSVFQNDVKEARELIEATAACREKSIDPEILTHDCVKKLIRILEKAENLAKTNEKSLECLTNNDLDVYLKRIER